MADADSLVGGLHGTLKVQLLLSPMYWMVRAAVVGSSGNVGGGLGVSLVAVWHCAGSLSLARSLEVELRGTARARASLRVVAARAPPGAPTLASHGPNVRCKKTNRATQRTNRACVSA